MKKFKLLLLSLFLVSCAHTNQKQMKKDLMGYEFKNHTEIKQDVLTMLEHHPELEKNEKDKVREILVDSLMKNRDLKLRESQATQHLLQLTLKEKAEYKEIESLRKAMKNIYSEKSKLFERTAVSLKKVLGIKIPNNEFSRETSAMFR